MRVLAAVCVCFALSGCTPSPAPRDAARDTSVDTPVDVAPDTAGDVALDAPPARDDVADVSQGLDAPDASTADAGAPLRVLVFSRTLGFRHASIAAGLRALGEIAAARGWSLTATEDPRAFEAARLAGTGVVVFLLTSGDVLDDGQQRDFAAWMAAGGGFVGVHSATDTEYDWPWYGELVGARFARHPAGTPEAAVVVDDPSHPSVSHLPPRSMRVDEWYSFQSAPEDHPALHPVLSLDESSFDLAPEFRMGRHPVAWYQYVHGGRSFQTALGHTEASYEDPAFRAHLAGAIAWAAGAPSPRVVLEEFNGVTTPGPWDMHQYDGSFDYAVTRDALAMYDRGHGNQHLTRRGVLVDPRRRYAVDALFVIHRASRAGLDTPINSFCLNLDVQGADGRSDDLAHLYTRAINLDLSSAPGGGGVMKHMGFVDGAFREIGQRPTACCDFDRAYRLSAEVNTRADGAFALDVVTVTLREGARVHERFEVDYASFPWRPDRSRPVRVGVNTHDTDWTLRDLRVRYLD